MLFDSRGNKKVGSKNVILKFGAVSNAVLISVWNRSSNTFAKKLINNYYTNNCDFVYSCIFPQLLQTRKQNLRNHFSDSIYLFKSTIETLEKDVKHVQS